MMNQTTLQFHSVLDMMDFQLIVNNYHLHPNITDLTVTASFSEADIELAKAGYNAMEIKGENDE